MKKYISNSFTIVFLKLIILNSQLLCHSVSANSNVPKNYLNKIFCVKDDDTMFDELNIVTIGNVHNKINETYIFISFTSKKNDFIKYLNNSKIANKSLKKEIDVTLYDLFKNDLPIFPKWFDKTEKMPSFRYECSWIPCALDKNNNKTSFGMVEINIDAYHVDKEVYQFYGVIIPAYVGFNKNGQEILVEKESFSKKSFLNLSP